MSKNKGFTLIEVLLALAVFSLVTVLLLISLSQILRRQTITTEQNHAAALLQQTVENVYLLTQSQADWDNLPTDGAIHYVGNDATVTNTAPSGQAYIATVVTEPAYRYKDPLVTEDALLKEKTYELNYVDCPTAVTNCVEDTDFKKVIVTVIRTADNTDILSSTHFLTLASNITKVNGTSDPVEALVPSVVPQNIPVSPGSNDATGTNYSAGTLNLLTAGGGPNSWVGMRFPGLNIPPNSTILQAEIVASVNGPYSPPTNLSYTAHVDSNPTNNDFTAAGAQCGVNRSCLPDTVTYTDADSNGTWLDGDLISFGNFSSLLQRLVQSPTWTGTSNVFTLLFNTTSSNGSLSLNSADTSSPPQLQLMYLTPTPTPTAMSGCGVCPAGQTCNTSLTPPVCQPTCAQSCLAGFYCSPLTLTCELPVGAKCATDSDCTGGLVCNPNTTPATCQRSNLAGISVMIPSTHYVTELTTTTCSSICMQVGSLCETIGLDTSGGGSGLLGDGGTDGYNLGADVAGNCATQYFRTNPVTNCDAPLKRWDTTYPTLNCNNLGPTDFAYCRCF